MWWSGGLGRICWRKNRTFTRDWDGDCVDGGSGHAIANTLTTRATPALHTGRLDLACCMPGLGNETIPHVAWYGSYEA